MNTFQFVHYLHTDFPIYSAKLIGDSYQIEWCKDGIYGDTFYAKSTVEDLIREGKWIVLNCFEECDFSGEIEEIL